MAADIPEILIICSCPTCITFNQPNFQELLTAFYKGAKNITFFGTYPDDLPKLPEGKSFDLIVFAGCNVLEWLFNKDYRTGIEQLVTVVKKDGRVIFVENSKYIERYGNATSKDYLPTIPIEHLAISAGASPHSNSEKAIGVKEAWNSVFNKSIYTPDGIHTYIVYTKRVAGGFRKTRSKRRSMKRGRRRYR
jgi:hypothetical protein